MNFAVLTLVPFLMALLFSIPQLPRLLPRAIRAWLSAAVMLALFVALASNFPALQSLDEAYRIQQGIPLEEVHYGDEEHTDEETASNELGESASAATEEAEVESAAETEAAADEETILVNALTQTIPWLPEYGMSFSFYLDGLSLLFSLIVTGVGTLVFLYAGFYFEEDDDQIRFLTALFAFAGAMLGLVLSGNLILMFVLWELTSITSFLLIGFKGAKSEDARFGAQQAFIITGLGGLALIAGVVLLGAIGGDILNGGGFVFEISQLLQADPEAFAAHPYYVGALLLLALAAFTKSAQFPFHFWLPGAMAAPTPASAYLHSATMVKAGVYLLLRLYPMMHTAELWTNLLVGFGIGTMFIGASIALFQRDLKGLLAYSTVSWLGALVGMIGLPEYAGIKAAFIGIMAHALYKAALFLAAGTIDHSFGTRIIDKLGGVRKYMPVTAGVVIISALSMAGLPIFFGFVAKEVLLDAWAEAHFAGQQITYILIILSAAFTGTAGFILIWDVFFKPADHELHYHASPMPLIAAPVVLVIGTTIFGLMLDPPITLIEDMAQLGVPKPIEIHLLPSEFTNPIFLTSLGIIAGGFVFFLLRGLWLPILSNIPIAKATDIYKGIISGVDWLGTQVLRTQNGQVRYYLIVIMGTVATVILTSGIILDLAVGQDIIPASFSFDPPTALRAILLLLTILAALYTVVARKHISAVLALGVLGYSIGVLFLLEPAPDVSIVQFLMETLATVLLIIILGRISERQRRDVMAKLWDGRSKIGNFNLGILRDLLIAGAAGLAVFFFALTALVNRGDRPSIAQYHLQNTYEQTGVTDVVGAIVADYRGMDTVIEVFVFSVAALGVLTLLTRGLELQSPLNPRARSVLPQREFEGEVLEEVQDATSLNTPFTQMVARIVLPLSFLVALSHIINGSDAPGDGFTAGAIAGLVTSLWYVVFGYEETKQRFNFLSPQRLIRIGLAIVVINAMIPVIFGLHGGEFLAHVDYGEILGIADFLKTFGLKLTSALVFEIGIAVTIFGGIGTITESIAHPKEVREQEDADEI